MFIGKFITDNMVKKVIRGPVGNAKVKNQWESVYNAISKMRSKFTAPVDIEGAGMITEDDTDPEVYRFQTLVGLMLSAQTRDSATSKKMQYLISKGLTIDNILKSTQEELAKDLYGVSFHNNKAKNILKTALILKQKYNSDIPGDYKIVSSLPGVGPKMTHLFLQICYDKVEGIAVDTHVHRVANRLGWVNTKTPVQTMNSLQKLLPKEKWADVNDLLVGFGQVVCKPIRPQCEKCSASSECPTGRKKLKLDSE
jgi:endonuclease III